MSSSLYYITRLPLGAMSCDAIGRLYFIVWSSDVLFIRFGSDYFVISILLLCYTVGVNTDCRLRLYVKE